MIPVLETATRELRLANGLTVLVREDRSSPVVAIVTHVKAGYFDEPDRLVGISHVMEHMFFKGTARRGVGDIARETKWAGGYLNAGTIYDYTSYYTVLPAASVEQGLDIQADALRNSALDADELRRELEVIIQEARRKLDSPGAVAVETLYQVMFDVHRMRRWRIGDEAGLRALTRDDLVAFRDAMYRPSNIILAVVGDVDAERVLPLIERLYGDMPERGEPLEPGPDEPYHEGPRYRELAGDLAQTYVELGWHTPGTLHPDTPALDLLAVAFGQGRASRLYHGVRDAGHASAISSYNYTPTDLGVFGIGAELEPARVRDALRAAGRELAAIAAEPLDAAELERARNIVEARMLRRRETVEGQASLLAEWQALGDWRLADDYLHRIMALEPADLLRVARAYLDPDDVAGVVYSPADAPSPGLDARALAELLTPADGAHAARPRPVQDAATRGEDAARAASRSTAGGVTRRPGAGDIRFFTLGDGTELVVRPRPASALVSMGISIRGGVLLEPRHRFGLTGLMAQTSVKGTARRSAAELAAETESLGGSISPGVAADVLGWSLSVPTRHFDAAFDLLADVVLRPTFPEAELERERRLALSEIARLRDDMYRYPLRLFMEAAFEGHPYGRSLDELAASITGLGRADLADWHRAQVLDAGPRIFVAGGLDADAVAGRIQALLARDGRAPGPGRRTNAAEATPPAPVWPASRRTRAEERERAQTALVLGFPGPARGDPDIYAMQVLSNALSGLGGRFFHELREERFLAYSVSVYPVTRWLGGALVAYVATAPEREDEARQALLDGFERLAEHGLEDDELERARRYTLGSWQIHGQTNGAHVSALSDALLLGGGVQDVLEFEDRIRAVDGDAIRRAVRRCYDPDRAVEGIVRGTRPAD